VNDPIGQVIDTSYRQALLKAANDADRIHRINMTPGRDVSPEDHAWVSAEPQVTLRRAVSFTVGPSLPGIAEWLRALAGGRPA
jgi:hypothetical protein